MSTILPKMVKKRNKRAERLVCFCSTAVTGASVTKEVRKRDTKINGMMAKTYVPMIKTKNKAKTMPTLATAWSWFSLPLQ